MGWLKRNTNFFDMINSVSCDLHFSRNCLAKRLFYSGSGKYQVKNTKKLPVNCIKQDFLFSRELISIITDKKAMLVECNKKKGKGCNLGGTNRKKIKTSGFRARIATKNGKRVIARRRNKGRALICPA